MGHVFRYDKLSMPENIQLFVNMVRFMDDSVVNWWCLFHSDPWTCSNILIKTVFGWLRYTNTAKNCVGGDPEIRHEFLHHYKPNIFLFTLFLKKHTCLTEKHFNNDTQVCLWPTCAGVSVSLIGCPSNLNLIWRIARPWRKTGEFYLDYICSKNVDKHNKQPDPGSVRYNYHQNGYFCAESLPVFHSMPSWVCWVQYVFLFWTGPPSHPDQPPSG